MNPPEISVCADCVHLSWPDGTMLKLYREGAVFIVEVNLNQVRTSRFTLQPPQPKGGDPWKRSC